MKKLTMLALLTSTTTAFSADLPMKATPIIPPPSFTWTGAYLGWSLGYGWSSFGNTISGGGLSADVPTNANGILGGVYAGYNYQLGNVVLGVESDFFWTNLRGGNAVNGHFETNPGSVPWAAQTDNRLSWLGSTRGRVGYAFGHFLPYVTGGVAYGNFSSNAIGVLGASSVNSNLAVPFSGSSTKVGWTVGAGLEYAVMANLITRVEYLHYDLGSTQWQVLTDPSVTLNSSNAGDLVRLGVAWKF